MRKTFLTLFPALQSVGTAAVHKDVGALAMSLKKYHGWNTTIAFLSEERSTSASDSFGFKGTVVLEPIKQSRLKLINFIRMMHYVYGSAVNFEVLNIYHGSLDQMVCGMIYHIKNPRGIVYCKLDMNHLTFGEITSPKSGWKKLKWYLKQRLSRRAVDVYSVETVEIFKGLRSTPYFKDRIHYIPNGVHVPSDADISTILRDKQNVILTVGRLGSPEKNTELLVEALTGLEPSLLADWKVMMVGPIVNPSFEGYMREKLELFPHLGDLISLTGRIDDRVALNGIYKCSKIFCLTLNYESFGFVLAEAMLFGNYIVASDMPSSRDLTKDGELGSLFPVGDVEALRQCLRHAVLREREFNGVRMSSCEFIRQRYSWDQIAGELNELLVGLVTKDKIGDIANECP